MRVCFATIKAILLDISSFTPPELVLLPYAERNGYLAVLLFISTIFLWRVSGQCLTGTFTSYQHLDPQLNLHILASKSCAVVASKLTSPSDVSPLTHQQM